MAHPTVREASAIPAESAGFVDGADAAASRGLRSLPRRLLSSVIPVSLVLAVLLWLPLWTFVLVVTWFVGAALHELFTMVRRRGVLVHRPLGIGLGIVFTGLIAWRMLVLRGLLVVPGVEAIEHQLHLLWDMFWPAAIILIFIRQLARKNIFEALNGLGTTLFGLAYIPALFSYILSIRSLDAERGALLVLFLILVTKMADTGAYTVGSLIGRHTLLARISPRKTVEGFAGAMGTAAITAALAAPLLGPSWGALSAAAMGLLLGLAGQVGDLAESLIKRDCQVKDSGSLMPGLGGVLDIIDSLLFTAPLFYAILMSR
ncbi:MAG TPA: phosphatidate cytidylyltransferase [bacterium]